MRRGSAVGGVGSGVGLGWRCGKANRAPSRLAGALSLWIGFGLSLRGTRLSRPVFDPLGRCRRPACGRWIRGRVLCLRGAAPRMRLGSGLPVGCVTRPRASDPGVCSGLARQPAGEPYLRRSVDIAHQAPLRHRQKTLSIKPASETDCPAPGEPRPGLGPHSGQLPALEPAPAPRSMRSAGPSRGWWPAPAPNGRPRRRGLQAVRTVSRQTIVGPDAAPHPGIDERRVDADSHPFVHSVLHAAFPMAGGHLEREGRSPHSAAGGG